MRDSDSTMPLIHHIIGMQILNAQPMKTIISSVQQLIYKFMTFPTPQSKYMMVYELEDEAPGTYFLET